MSAQSSGSTSEPTASARALTRPTGAVDSEVALPNREGSALALIERGRAALEEATTLEDAQHVLAQTKVLEAATRAVNLTVEVISQAGALRVRAERRVGELIAATARKPGQGRPRKVSEQPTLPDLGISRDESSRFQRLAKIPELQFEEALGEVQEAATEGHGSATSTAVLRLVNPEQEKRPDERWLDGDRFIDRCRNLLKDAPAMLELVRFGRYPGSEEGIVHDAALRIVEELAQDLARIRTEIERKRP